MPARLTIDGLTEFQQALTQLPARLRDQARIIVQATADAAEATIRAAYPARTGNLRDGFKQLPRDPTWGARVTLSNTAPHAFLYEYGTEMRQTKLGHPTGRMPAAKIFVPEVIDERRRMILDQLIPLVEAEGLDVHGY